MKREQLFRGKSIEEIKNMNLREFSNLVDARARRSILRKSEIIENFIRRIEKKNNVKKQIKTHLRDIIIVPKFLDFTINVHNGKEFVPVTIKPNMLGHRLGEFAMTRGQVKHSAPGIGATRSSAAKSVK